MVGASEEHFETHSAVSFKAFREQDNDLIYADSLYSIKDSHDTALFDSTQDSPTLLCTGEVHKNYAYFVTVALNKFVSMVVKLLVL